MPCGEPYQFDIGRISQVVEYSTGGNRGATWYSVPALFDGDGNPHVTILAAHTGSGANGVALLPLWP